MTKLQHLVFSSKILASLCHQVTKLKLPAEWLSEYRMRVTIINVVTIKNYIYYLSKNKVGT